MHVAHNVFTQPCLDPIDNVLFIYVAIDDVALAGRRLDRWAPGQEGVVLAIDLAAARGGVVRSGAFQETPGRDVKLQGVGPGLRDIRLLGRDLLEKRSGHRRRCAATRRIVRRSRVTRRRGRQIDHADVVVYRPHRIMGSPADHVDRVRSALLEGHILGRSRIRDGFQIAQCFLHVGGYGFCVLRHGVPTQVHEADCDYSKLFHHSYSSLTEKQNRHADRVHGLRTIPAGVIQ